MKYQKEFEEWYRGRVCLSKSHLEKRTSESYVFEDIQIAYTAFSDQQTKLEKQQLSIAAQQEKIEKLEQQLRIKDCPNPRCSGGIEVMRDKGSYSAIG